MYLPGAGSLEDSPSAGLSERDEDIFRCSLFLFLVFSLLYSILYDDLQWFIREARYSDSLCRDERENKMAAAYNVKIKKISIEIKRM